MPLGRLSLAAAIVLSLVAACTSTSGGGASSASGGSASSASSTAGTASGSVASTSASAGSGGAGTGGGGGGGGAVFVPSGFACSSKKPSLDSDVVPITTSNCTTSAACHLAMTSGPGIYDQLVNRVAEECDDLRMMITPGDPEHSYVIHKLTGHNLCSPPTTMPLDQAQLGDADIQTIYDWICEGCPQN
jgi:hypothetical protein